MSAEEHIEHRHGAQIDPSATGHAELERAIAVVASRQHGRVSRSQLLALGLHRRSISRRIATGRLHVIYPGVYAVGHSAGSPWAARMTAVLAMGEGGALSDRAAAAAWGLRASSAARIEVSVPRRKRPHRGLVIHRRRLLPDEVTTLNGVPITTVARTILDCAGSLDVAGLRRILNEAEIHGVPEPLSVPDLLRRHPGRRGAATLRLVLEQMHAGEGITQAGLEDRFLRFVEEVGLPRPEVDARIEVRGRSWQCDCVWREQRLAVELDSRTFHATRQAFESDRSRDRAFEVAGWHVVRVTWRQLSQERAELEADLRVLLGLASS